MRSTPVQLGGRTDGPACACPPAPVHDSLTRLTDLHARHAQQSLLPSASLKSFQGKRTAINIPNTQPHRRSFRGERPDIGYMMWHGRTRTAQSHQRAVCRRSRRVRSRRLRLRCTRCTAWHGTAQHSTAHLHSVHSMHAYAHARHGHHGRHARHARAYTHARTHTRTHAS